jgi:Fe-S-cluster containining protein
MKKIMWKCKRCGICCRFIYVPVEQPIDLNTEEYLMAHGIAYDGEKLIISAVCQHLALEYKKEGENGFIYKCNIHNDNFANCRLNGEKECVEAKKAWKLLVEMIKDGRKK